VPKNSPYPIIIAGLATLAGFAFIWHIWWLGILALAALLVSVFMHTLSDEDGERVIPASEVRAREEAWRKRRKMA
jgi:cytochrome o ubiquinol oxidase subunit 1